MAQPSRITKQSYRKLLMALLALLLLAAIGSAAYYWTYTSHHQAKAPTTSSNHGSTYVNQSPATTEEKQASESTKGTPNPTPVPTPTSGGKQTVSVVLTVTDPSNVRAYVPGIIEDGGTCTATFTQGTTTKSGTSTGVSNVSNTTCPAIQIDGVGKGTWTLTYTYESASFKGTTSKSITL